MEGGVVVRRFWQGVLSNCSRRLTTNMGCHILVLAISGTLLPFQSTATVLDRRAAVDACLAELNVPIYASNTTTYAQAVKPFNIRVSFTPAAYAVPATVEDVQNAVSCGAKNAIRVSAKSGGHSYASHGLGGENGHLVLDMRNFNTVSVDQAAQTAVIGTGNRLGNVATALYKQGKQAISHGTCPGVGVGGLSLHGGYGMSSRTRGLTLDNVVEATVVLANSSVVTASTSKNPDLFWALRGAGAAFGIVTNFKFKTFTAPEANIVFEYSVTPSNASHLSSILSVLQDFSLNTQPTELNMRFTLAPFGTTLSGVYYGTNATFNETMTPLLQKLSINPAGSRGRPTNSTKNWIDTLTTYAYAQLEQPAVYTAQENFFAKSLMPESLSTPALDALSAYWYSTARSINRAWYLMIDLHSGAHSAISAVSKDATSYAHRNAVFKMQFYDRVYGGSYDNKWQSFLNGWVDAILKASGPEEKHTMYINYADTSLTSEEAHRRYWGGNYEKLVRVKKSVDPGNVFGGPQIVVP
ncbi:Glucooligosaccharide oxidase [Sporormia fimetaria CBS 119925]|uniref:Glucooligosaccharide oxidase n=1 Tax=Sporormia fimetaria CBS 119925 TaxID=1340428 RepID=A0A6A6V3K1_9PLEO|nr:Glucooligosaccharide oxidase [Sporormia fimetaria CBS 119925]